jgi:hypothetical protein
LNFDGEGGESKRCLKKRKKRKNPTKMKTSKRKRTQKSSARANLRQKKKEVVWLVKKEITFFIESGENVHLEKNEILALIPEKELKKKGTGVSLKFETHLYSYVSELQPLMEEISRKKEKKMSPFPKSTGEILSGYYSIGVVVDVGKKEITKITKFE